MGLPFVTAMFLVKRTDVATRFATVVLPNCTGGWRDRGGRNVWMNESRPSTASMPPFVLLRQSLFLDGSDSGSGHASRANSSHSPRIVANNSGGTLRSRLAFCCFATSHSSTCCAVVSVSVSSEAAHAVPHASAVTSEVSRAVSSSSSGTIADSNVPKPPSRSAEVGGGSNSGDWRETAMIFVRSGEAVTEAGVPGDRERGDGGGEGVQSRSSSSGRDSGSCSVWRDGGSCSVWTPGDCPIWMLSYLLVVLHAKSGSACDHEKPVLSDGSLQRISAPVDQEGAARSASSSKSGSLGDTQDEPELADGFRPARGGSGGSLHAFA